MAVVTTGAPTRAIDPDILCTLCPQEPHPIVDPVLLACDHNGQKPVFNRVCLLVKGLMPQTSQVHVGCPVCKRALIALTLFRYVRHPVLQKITHYMQANAEEANAFKDKFEQEEDRTLQGNMQVEYQAARSMITPTPIDDFGKLAFRDFACRLVKSRLEAQIGDIIPLESHYTLVNERLYCEFSFRRFKYKFSLSKENRLEFHSIDNTSWTEYLRYIWEKELSFSAKTVIKAAGLASVLIGGSLATYYFPRSMYGLGVGGGLAAIAIWGFHKITGGRNGN